MGERLAGRSANALVDDPDWCGHPFVSLRTWTCGVCQRPVTPATRTRLKGAATIAPPGFLWVLLVTNDADENTEPCEGQFYGMFTDRARIGQILIRDMMTGAADIRDRIRRTHWYQGVFNPGVVQGFGEEPDTRGRYQVYEITLEAIDRG